jgi:RHS repeat-associated protein
MTLLRLRKRSSKIALVTLLVWGAEFVLPNLARAELQDLREHEANEVLREVNENEPVHSHSSSDLSRVKPEVASAVKERGAAGAADQLRAAPELGGTRAPASTPVLSLPQGAGKLRGMGESFSAELSTGIATYSVPFELITARGAVQPQLGLSYSSSGGHGIAGVGWGVGAPAISRQLDRGIPRYIDPTPGGAWTPDQDRFVFGSAELVPICLVEGASCVGAQTGEVMPDWASGWQYFRARIEGGFQRFFWSPDRRTWRVQDKSGATMELGVPLDGSGDTSGLEDDPANPAHIFTWHLARQYDANRDSSPPEGATAAPTNAIVYRYQRRSGISYLTDIYDTTPASTPTSTVLATYAHHTHLVYETRPDATMSYRRGWRVDTTLRLKGVDVTSHNYAGDSPTRELVRRYHLTYDDKFHASHLVAVAMEGRCETTIAENSAGELPESTGCPHLPAMEFEYQHVDPYGSDGNASFKDLAGFEGFDERVRSFSGSPPHSINTEQTDLFDINADGLPDVLVTAPALFGGRHGVYFNGARGRRDAFGEADGITVQGALGEDANVLKLSNFNLSSLDLDGDGIVNLVHMPKVKTYSIYAPQQSSAGWAWRGRTVSTASEQNAKIDFTGDNADIRTMDVNADGLVDVVYSAGTEYRTFFSLGRYPRGDGQFGIGRWTGADAANISNEPERRCVPWSSLPVRLSDPEVRVADMNGDGFPDIARVQPGQVRYWPGRGNGYWGTGDPEACGAGTFGQRLDIEMGDSPQFGVSGSDELMLSDVNGDALADLVKVNFNRVDVFLNVDGKSWTPRHVIANAPVNPTWSSRLRLTDANGSGTEDLLWGDGNAYRYMDLAGGKRPSLLIKVKNGLGRTTEFEYSTSVEQMLAAEAAGDPWQSKAPMPVHVVSRIVDRDNLERIGRSGGTYVTEYTYRDPVYEGRQREFRGFRSVRAKKLGDANSPASIAESTFLLGECREEGLPGRCDAEQRWRDNPREALKGLPVVTETFAESGTYLSTDHTTYRLRWLYTGLDGREVRHAFASSTDTYRYDTGPFVASTSTVQVDDVELEPRSGSIQNDTPRQMTLRSAQGRAHLTTHSAVDVFGNGTTQSSEGCVAGCVESDETITKHSVPGRPEGDTSGWLWRSVQSYVTGATDPLSQRSHLHFFYDRAGNLTATTAELSGTLPLERFHQTSGRDTALPPPKAASDGTVLLKAADYSKFGYSTYQSTPNGHCTSIYYDDAYAQLPRYESLTVGQGEFSCGAFDIETRAPTYDRGLGVVTRLVDVRGAVSTVRYDGFGRVTAILKPDPDVFVPYHEDPWVEPGPIPVMKVSYFLPESDATPYSRILVETQDGNAATTDTFHAAWSYVDGLGRTIVSLNEADPSGGDGGSWTVDGLTDYDRKGAKSRGYLSYFWSGDGGAFPLAAASFTPFTRQRYDAFGRAVQSYGLDGSVTLKSVYHAMSTDAWDAADLEPGPHHGTFATTRADGHGRTASAIERVHQGSQVEAHEVKTTYLPTGEPLVIARLRSGSSPVVRWFRYDSLGRMVLNVDPNTTKDFVADPAADPSTFKAWRYAYTIEGELVGTSDARGCGVNYHYEPSGRPVGEDFSPCREEHVEYSAPNLMTGDGLELYQRYDFVDEDAASIPDFPSRHASMMRGQVASVSDRGAKNVLAYDGRARVTHVARKIARPGPPLPAVADRYAPHWFMQTTTYDGADRPVVTSTGADVAELLGGDPASSAVVTNYSARGTVRSVGSSYGALVSNVTRDADGLIQQIGYGDVAQTSTHFQYDQRRRVSSVQTDRGPPALWSQVPAAYTPAPPSPGAGPTTLQLILEDTSFSYDVVDNPVEIRDWRSPEDWPQGAKPVTQIAEYDDLYRLKNIQYRYAAGDDSWVSPFAAENLDPTGRTKPSPHVAFDKRVLEQSFNYDWLGNTTATNDDAHGFYDRSLGVVTNGSATAGPYRLQAASLSTGGGTRDGSLTTVYDDAGNLTSLALSRAGTCLPAGADCSQRFAYEWDEAGRLTRARRWDLANPGVATDALPSGTPAAELRYAYDGGNQRTLKTAVDPSGNQLHAVSVFPSLELRRAAWTVEGDYERTSATEVAYLSAHGVRLARLYYAGNDVPTLSSGHLHVLFELPDHLGSSTFVIDGATSELVEATRYQAYGATESDYRPGRWAAYREDYRFTGKEEDIEVGLTYFGQRYLSAGLNRWVSVDPLTIHGLQADVNVYAYVHGRVLVAIDPLGLADTPPVGSPENPVATSELPPGTAGAEVKAGQIFTYIPGNNSAGGVKTFDSVDAAHAAGGKFFFQYQPGAKGWAHAREVSDAAHALDSLPSYGMTAGDLAQRIAHPLTDPTAEGKSGGVAAGKCNSCPGNEGVQHLEAGFQLYSMVNMARALGSALKAGIGYAASRIAAYRAAQKVATQTVSPFTTVMAEDGVKIIEVATSKGVKLEVAFEEVREGTTLTLRGAHIAGSKPGQIGPKELIELAKQYGREQGAERVIVEGAKRTTSSMAGKVPRPWVLDVNK